MKYNVNNKQLIFDDSFLKIEKAELTIDTYDKGKMDITRYGLLRPRVVTALIYLTDTKQLVLVEQFRYSALRTTSGWICEIVAGLIDEGEDSQEAAKREILEETGYKISDNGEMF